MHSIRTRLSVSGWLLAAGLLIAAAGCGGDQPPGADPLVVPAGATELPFRLTDVTQEAGLGDWRHETGAFGEKWFPESMGSGCGFFDYDGDGWSDVILLGGGTWPGTDVEPVPALTLFRNNRDGTYTDVTEEAGLADVDAYTLGVTAADYDNDGDQDFYLTNIYENMLFRNEPAPSGQGRRFVEVGDPAGVAGEPRWGSSAVFFDADRDGWLDLYVGNYVEWTPETDIWCSLDGELKGYCTPETYQGVAPRFYHNDGDGTFSDWTERAGFWPSPGKTLGAVQLDFNRDGWPDLMVANDTEPDNLYVNQGDGTFEDRGTISGVAYDENGKARAGMGVDAGVVDSTGEVSIFVGNFSREMIGVYRHIGNGLFLDRAAASKIGRPSLMRLTFGIMLADLDLDGDLDLFAANGHVQPDVERTQEGIDYAEPAHLFINAGDGTFQDYATTVGGVLDKAVVARGSAYADFDRDGDVDILMVENDGPAHIWRNDRLTDVRSLRVDVEGRESNRDGIGTRIVAWVDGYPMERIIRGGVSYLSVSEKVATFGVGTAARVDSLALHWPSGRVDRFRDVPAGQDILVVEGTGEWTPVARTPSGQLAAAAP